MESREHLEQAVAILGHPMPGSRLPLVLGVLGQIARRVWRQVRSARETPAPRPREKTPWRPPADKEVAAQVALLEAARAYERLAQIYYLANNTYRGLFAILCTLSLAERAGPSPELARAYAGMCVAAGVFSLPALAQMYRDLALNTIRRVRELSAEAWVLATLGLYETGVGQWAEAEAGISRATEIFDQLGDRRDWGNNLVSLCWVDYFRGQFASSAQRYADVYTVGRESGNIELQAWALSGQALSLLRLGQTDQAVTFWEQALPLLTQITESRVTETLTYGALAVAQLRRGETALARQAADAAIRLIRRFPAATFPTFDGYAGPAEVYLSLWEADPHNPQSEFKALTRQACEALRRYARAYPIGQPRAWLCQGWRDWLAGKPAQAQQAWQKSLTAAERLAMPYEAGLAHYAIGRRAHGQERQTHLKRALEIFEQLGAAYDAAQTRTQIAAEKV